MNKSTLLSEVKTALVSGIITKKDLQKIMDDHPSGGSTQVASSEKRLSAIDVMFYIAGIVLFGAILALVAQAWDSGAATRILLSAGVGVLFWGLASYLIQSPRKDDIRGGFTNALLLAGSLLIVSGGFIIANEFVSYDNFQFYATAATLLVLGVIHIAFGWQIKRDILSLLGVMLTVAAFPSFVFGLLSEGDTPMLVYWLILAVSAGLLAYATRVVSWIGITSKGMGQAFDPLSAFGVLGSLYAASYDDMTGIIWLLVLIAGIFGLFYLSIIKQNRMLLGSGSFFLVLTIITISFRYFSGYSAAASLLISALGLLGTAVVATSINRRYIK